MAQSITTIPNLDDMLNKTVELLAQQFGYYQASIFMVDRGGKYAEFKAGYGPATIGLKERKYRLEVGSASIIGWVAAKNQVRITSDVLEDPLHLKNEFLPETRSEASVPISLGDWCWESWTFKARLRANSARTQSSCCKPWRARSRRQSRPAG
ncbi:MAG: GAF domain-containing protein [Chloroflexi bacterium]|nr:GAF domain-containing protein [Chloroflexota bacterium]